MNLLQELQARTLEASKSTDEEVQSICDAIRALCLRAADMGKDSVFIDTSDIDDRSDCRESAFDDAFARAMTRVADSGVTVKSTREEHLFMLLWEA